MFMTLTAFNAQTLAKDQFVSTVWPYAGQKLTRQGRIGSWRAIHWWITENFDTLGLRKRLSCKMLGDEAMQRGCQGAASTGCLLQAGKPGAAGDPGTGYALTDGTPSHRLRPRWPEPAAGNPNHQQPLTLRGDEPGPGSSRRTGSE